MLGVFVDANLVIFIDCFVKNLIELPMPHDFANDISVFKFAGPGMPAWISNSIPRLEICVSQDLNDWASKKNCVTKYNLKSTFLENLFFSIIASSSYDEDISGFPSGCPARPTSLKLYFDSIPLLKYRVFNFK